MLFVRYTKPRPKITLRQFYAKGELGLASLIIALSVIVDIRKSPNLQNSVGIFVFGLSGFAFASVYVWAVPLCTDLLLSSIPSSSHQKETVDWVKVWRESSGTAVMVFSVCLVAEILVELAT